MTKKKFITIYEALKEEILDGSLSYGDQIPSENDLVQTYQASRETVRKALHLLVSDGMIQKIRGKGSIVIDQGITEFPFSELISFKEVQEELNLKHETEVLINELVKANSVPHVKKQLNISNDDVLIHVVRTRNVNQKVKILDEDYFLTSIVSNISDSVAKDSIYHYLETQLG